MGVVISSLLRFPAYYVMADIGSVTDENDVTFARRLTVDAGSPPFRAGRSTRSPNSVGRRFALPSPSAPRDTRRGVRAGWRGFLPGVSNWPELGYEKTRRKRTQFAVLAALGSLWPCMFLLITAE